MKRGEQSWVFLLDARGGRLMRAAPTPTGRVHLEELERFATRIPEPERGRPSPLKVRGIRAYPSRQNAEIEERRQQVRQLASWVVRCLRRRPLRARIVAAPRLLAPLRKELLTSLDGRGSCPVSLSRGELARWSTARLQCAPQIVKWLASEAKGERVA